MYQEIALITQNKTLIASSYRGIIEQYVLAVPKSKMIFGNVFRYRFFASFAMTTKQQYNSISVKKDKKIFNLYTSGAISVQKSIVMKFVYFLIFVLIALILFVVFFFPRVFNKNPKENDKKDNKVSSASVNINNLKYPIQNNSFNTGVSSSKILVTFVCDDTECRFDDEYISYKYLKIFISKTNPSLFYRSLIYKKKDYKLYSLKMFVNLDKFYLYFPELKRDTKNYNFRSPSAWNSKK